MSLEGSKRRTAIWLLEDAYTKIISAASRSTNEKLVNVSEGITSSYFSTEALDSRVNNISQASLGIRLALSTLSSDDYQTGLVSMSSMVQLLAQVFSQSSETKSRFIRRKDGPPAVISSPDLLKQSLESLNNFLRTIPYCKIQTVVISSRKNNKSPAGAGLASIVISFDLGELEADEWRLFQQTKYRHKRQTVSSIGVQLSYLNAGIILANAAGAEVQTTVVSRKKSKAALTLTFRASEQLSLFE